MQSSGELWLIDLLLIVIICGKIIFQIKVFQIIHTCFSKQIVLFYQNFSYIQLHLEF